MRARNVCLRFLFIFIVSIGIVVYIFLDLFGELDLTVYLPNNHQLPASFLRNQLEIAETKWEISVAKREEAVKKYREIENTSILDPSVLWNILHASFQCPYMVEIVGEAGDGGKWICGLPLISSQDRPCIVYSFGINNEDSFEQNLLEKTSNCIVRIFGYASEEQDEVGMEALVQRFGTRVTFQKLDVVAPSNSSNDKMSVLGSAMLVYKDEFIDILNIDIEGEEFSLLTRIIEEFRDSSELTFGQLQIQLHVSDFKAEGNNALDEFLSWWKNLEAAGLRPFHREAYYLNTVIQGRFPVLFEYSFINVKIDRNILIRGS